MRLARIAGLALCLVVLAPASAGAVGWMTPATDLSAAGQDADAGSPSGGGPGVAVSPQRDITWVWVRSDGTNDITQTRTLKADGTLTAVQDLSDPGQDASKPDVAVDADGNAYFTWIRNDGTFNRGQTRRRDAATGTLSSTEDVNTDSSSVSDLDVAVDDAGDATYAWDKSTGGSDVLSRTRSAGGTWTPALTDPPDLLGGGLAPVDVTVDVNGSGDAVIAWTGGGSNPPPSFQAQSRYRKADGTWLPALVDPASNVSSFSRLITHPRVGVAADGSAVLMWQRALTTTPNPGTYIVESRRLAADGATFGGIDDLTNASNAYTQLPNLAVNSGGDAMFVWEAPTTDGLLARQQAADGTYTPALSAQPSVVSDDGSRARVGLSDSDVATIVWDGFDGTNSIASARRRNADGSFTPALGAAPDRLSAGGQDASKPDVAVDADGDGAAVWTRSDGTNELAQGIALDGTPPVLSAVSFPAGGPIGIPLPFSASATDRWSTPTLAWAFGDGASAPGGSVSHSYGAAGSYGARVTATDAAGNTATATATVAIRQPPDGGGGGGGGPSPAKAPEISGYSVGPATFAAASRGASIARKAATGTTVRYTLSKDAKVTFTVERIRAGRRVSGRCRTATRANRRKPRCDLALAGSFARASKTGRNSFRFTGRLRGHRLAPGSYRLVATASDSGGRRSAARRASFRIVAR